MTLLPCWIKGRIFRLQTNPEGIKAGEYCFSCDGPRVSFEDCIKCRETDCEYGFNLFRLLERPALREKVLKYIYDASLDDELLIAGIAPSRTIKLKPYFTSGAIVSKPCLDKKRGKKLMELEEAMMQEIAKLREMRQKISDLIEESAHLPLRRTRKDRPNE